MILQQNSPFSQSHQENLEVLSFPLGSNVAACKLWNADFLLGAYFLAEGEKYIDLSYNHLYNPLGHNHPINIKGNWTLSKFMGYSVKKFSKSDEEGNFIQRPEELFKELKAEREVIDVRNFHGKSFQLIKGLESGEPHPIFHYLNYYFRLKIFEEGGLYQFISQKFDSELRVGKRKGLVIHFDKKLNLETLASNGIFIEEDQDDMVFIPLAIHIEDIEYIIKVLNGGLCFN